MKHDISRLVAYGIQTEETTHRIHVDVKNKRAFTYKTVDGVRALPDPVIPGSDKEFTVSGYYTVSPPWLKDSDKGIATARGVRVPYSEIPNCRVSAFSADIDTGNMSTTDKGKIAVEIVQRLFKVGKIPLHLDVIDVDNRSDQIKGKDIDIGNVVIQVKHDAGCAERGLFLQTHESNPYSMH